MGFQVEPENDGSKRKSGCANVSGFSLHANVCIPAKARRQLENLCRYVARPAVAMERLSILPDGRVSYRLRHKWRDGTTHVLFEPLELVEKLAALVPPPRFHLVRYSGIFAPASPWRSQIVPFHQEEANSVHHSGCGGKEQRENADGKDIPKSVSNHPRNYSWAELMKRVWDVDVLKCNRCGGRMRILCAINASGAIVKILDCLGLPSRPPPIYPAIRDTYIVD
jgi:hypothetical protein